MGTDVYITEKGYAFVTMADDEGASQAVKELNGQVVDGQEIKVDNAHSNSGGGRGGDRRGGRGGGGFRGRSFGRGGRGGFGGGRGRGCYNCNQDGHIARECPEGNSGGYG